MPTFGLCRGTSPAQFGLASRKKSRRTRQRWQRRGCRGMMGRSVLLGGRNHLNQFPTLAGVGSDRVIWTLTSETTFVSRTPANGGTARSTHVQMLQRIIESNSRLLHIGDKDGGYSMLRYCLRSTVPGGVHFILKGGNSVVHKIACPFSSSVSVQNLKAPLLVLLLPT